MHRVLVMGEGPDQSKSLAFRLGLSKLETAASAAELPLAVRSIMTFRPDLILLDSSGDPTRELFTFLCEATDTPIVILGDQRLQDELVWFLERGAADYLSRGMSEKVLAVRIAAIVGRFHEVSGRGVLEVGSLEVDTDRNEVRKDGEVVRLTPTEYRVLLVLAENAGKLCSHRALLTRVWGDEFRQCAHYLRLYVGYLRNKLEDDPRNPRLLRTEWGSGYRLVSDRRLDDPLTVGRFAASP